MKLLQELDGLKDRAFEWPIECDIADWMRGKVIDFAPSWSTLEVEDQFDYQQRGRKPECDTAVFIGLAHRTQDPLGAIREFIGKIKARQYVVHFLVRIQPKTPKNAGWSLIEPVDALAFRNEIGAAEVRASADRKRFPTSWYMRIEGSDIGDIEELDADPKSVGQAEESAQDVAVEVSTDAPVWGEADGE